MINSEPAEITSYDMAYPLGKRRFSLICMSRTGGRKPPKETSESAMSIIDFFCLTEEDLDSEVLGGLVHPTEISEEEIDRMVAERKIPSNPFLNQLIIA